MSRFFRAKLHFMDHIDRILEQWRQVRPDLQVAPMGTIGRIKQLNHQLLRGMEKTWSAHGLHHASFDVLATLRRAGAPYALSPGDLMASTMVTSGTMTNRIDQLEKAGLVERVRNPDDGRGFLVSLTPRGYELIDEAVENARRNAEANEITNCDFEHGDILHLFGPDFVERHGRPDVPIVGDSNAVLVNQTFARRLFGRDDVVGEPFPLNLQNRAQPQIVGVLADKDAAGIVDALRPRVDRWVAVTPDSPRAIAARDLASIIAHRCGKPCLIMDAVTDALRHVDAHASRDTLGLVTGSFYTVGPALQYLRKA